MENGNGKGCVAKTLLALFCAEYTLALAGTIALSVHHEVAMGPSYIWMLMLIQTVLAWIVFVLRCSHSCVIKSYKQIMSFSVMLCQIAFAVTLPFGALAVLNIDEQDKDVYMEGHKVLWHMFIVVLIAGIAYCIVAIYVAFKVCTAEERNDEEITRRLVEQDGNINA